MGRELNMLGEKILERKNEIAKKVHEIRISDATEEQKQLLLSMINEKEIIEVRAGFVSMFGEALLDGVSKEEAYEKIEKWAKETGEFTYSMGIPLDEALKDTSYYRSFIYEVLEEEVLRHDMSVKTVFEVARKIDPLLDHAVYCFSLTYVHYYRNTMEASKNAFLELSVPVVPLTNGIAILPLIGNVDTERAQLIMEEALDAAVKLKLNTLIIDLSGVMIVDTMVADQLFKVISSLELLGVQSVLTGIRPEIAQTVIKMGINFANVNIKTNLQQAFEELDRKNKKHL
ncbi:STAS domain-containing protein [Neobacillus notoginsengisoli]|uniref:STAS domain-containing protein n=1 Tax=Neobacillus notoginsengisoli TaxID=1578198 RepID=A0A417YRU8_9BACI|nr:STAS domain-containing protein [Neobacillus notoginsengisoli]RHW38016.1 STAS domain-containing protein [Neobacillus notoginsengisoli]